MLEKKEKIRQGGGEKKVAKQHGAGKLTARERIDLLFDPGTFQEYNIFMKHRCHDFGMEKVDTPAEGVVTGYGLIMGEGPLPLPTTLRSWAAPWGRCRA